MLRILPPAPRRRPSRPVDATDMIFTACQDLHMLQRPEVGSSFRRRGCRTLAASASPPACPLHSERLELRRRRIASWRSAPMLSTVKKRALRYARAVGVPGTITAQAIFQDGSEQE